MAQVVTQLPNTEARVYACISPCGFVVDKVALGQVFLLRSLVFTCQYHAIMAFHTYIYHLGDERLACWWPQFRNIISRHEHEQQHSLTTVVTHKNLIFTEMLFNS
jgi:hypothetical protein